jgi:hypothetical protein
MQCGLSWHSSSFMRVTSSWGSGIVPCSPCIRLASVRISVFVRAMKSAAAAPLSDTSAMTTLSVCGPMWKKS